MSTSTPLDPNRPYDPNDPNRDKDRPPGYRPPDPAKESG